MFDNSPYSRRTAWWQTHFATFERPYVLPGQTILFDREPLAVKDDPYWSYSTVFFGNSLGGLLLNRSRFFYRHSAVPATFILRSHWLSLSNCAGITPLSSPTNSIASTAGIDFIPLGTMAEGEKVSPIPVFP
jgi:hypothetical protein